MKLLRRAGGGALTRASWVGWRMLALTQLRAQPLRTLATVLAIALGIALGCAVYLIEGAALTEFDRATRRLLGNADLIVRGPPSGFDEQLFVALAHRPEVSDASPMLELEASLPARGAHLKVLGLDLFRAQLLQPALLAAISTDVMPLLASDAIVLSRAAAEQLHLRRGDPLPIIVGGRLRTLRVIDLMPAEAYGEPLGIMDIASAQWTLDQLGKLDRVDLRLRAGVDAAALRRALSASLPAGSVIVLPQIESERASNATRAYRVNLNMLALVALLTGAFLVFSTQSLAVLRRRAALALLRALGLRRGELQCALIGEGVAIGLLGSLLGVLLAALIATAVLHTLGTDLGNGQMAAFAGRVTLKPWVLAGFVLLGTGVATLGAWLPAHHASRRAPALSLKAGGVAPLPPRLATTLPALALLIVGSLLALAPPIGAIPWSGYLSIGALLTGAVLAVPALMSALTRLTPRTGLVPLDLSCAQLKATAASSSISLASIIVSFSLMVAMSIMVHSFRHSFELWLVKLLPADLQLSAGLGGDTGALTLAEQARIGALPSIARADFRRVQSILLRPEAAPVTLIARAISSADAAQVLPLVSRTAALSNHAHAAWISESLADLYGYRPGDDIELPLAGRPERFVVAAVWRDYVHAAGAIVIARGDYIGATGDASANEASLWQQPHSDAAATESAVRALVPAGALQMILGTALRERSLLAFDRVFLITYALEVVAVLVGLAGISVAASSAALARRAQFGLLRHLGLLRRQVLSMLACEGILQGTLAALWGLATGSALSVILVRVINRQSFHWSIDLAIPWSELAGLALALIAASALTALICGRAAMGEDVVRAVREDW